MTEGVSVSIFLAGGNSVRFISGIDDPAIRILLTALLTRSSAEGARQDSVVQITVLGEHGERSIHFLRSALIGIETDPGVMLVVTADGNVIIQPTQVAEPQSEEPVPVAVQESVEAAGQNNTIAILRRQLCRDPGNPEVHRELAEALPQSGEPGAASLAIIHAQIADIPNDAGHFNNLALLYQERDLLEEAERLFDRALELDPGSGCALGNLANNHLKRGQVECAVAIYEQALTASPGDAGSRANLAHAQLLAGNLVDGFANYEAIWGDAGRAESQQRFTQPMWKGEPLDGRRILLHAELGFGDAIWTARYCPLVKARGGSVIVETYEPLCGLFRSLPGVDAVIARGSELPPYDVHARLLSLPHLFETALDSIPAPAPYLRPGSDRHLTWWRRVGTERRLKVALVWAGNPDHPNDHNRSVTLPLLAPVLAVDGVAFYSLQMPPKNGEIANTGNAGRIADVSPLIRDFEDTAAGLLNMDLLIGVDTSIVHLAGALGVPSWLLLPFNPDWRWLTKRSDSPWYPSLRLYRQQRVGDWTAPISSIADDLRRLAQTRRR